MGIVLRIHATSATRSRLAAKSANRSAVTPASRAFGKASKAVHHSAGMRSLCHHLETEVAGWPISAASVSRLGQSSMTDRNESMPDVLGLSVPNVKAILSRDMGMAQGHPVLMGAEETATEEAWRRAFKLRVKEARGRRSQEIMADLLGVSRDAYSKYEALSRDTVLPTRLLVKFAHICGQELDWLIEGPKPAATNHRQAAKEPAEKQRHKKRTARGS